MSLNEAAEHGNMVRDVRDEWPSDEPRGSFDIDLSSGGIEGYPGANGHILFVCPNGKRCGVLLGPQAVHRDQSPGGRLCIWAWDGNLDRPTLTPSIDCRGCGWHGFITAGVMK